MERFLPPRSGAARSLSPLAWAILADSPPLVRALLEDPQVEFHDAIRPGENALEFALKKRASLDTVAALLRYPHIPAAWLAERLKAVTIWTPGRFFYNRRLRRLLHDRLHGKNAYAPLPTTRTSPAFTHSLIK